MTTIYIGPYLVVPPTLQRSLTHKRECSASCSNPSVAKPAKFCGNCGSPVVEMESSIEATRPISIHQMADKWTDFMHCPEHGQRHPKGDIWLPNQGEHGISLGRGAEDHFSPVELSQLDVLTMLEKAYREFGDFVVALETDHGVKASWEVGVLAYSY